MYALTCIEIVNELSNAKQQTIIFKSRHAYSLDQAIRDNRTRGVIC